MKNQNDIDDKKKSVISEINEAELIELLKKVNDDYSMLDNKLKDIFSKVANKNKELNVLPEKYKIDESSYDEVVELRNKIISELLKNIKN